MHNQTTDIPDFLYLPCVSLTTCFEAPSISIDTGITVLDANKSVEYKCSENHFFNFSESKYPSSVEATCSMNQAFEILPFWKIEEETFPLNPDENICLSNEICQDTLPDLPSHLTRSGMKDYQVGSKFRFFCEMEGERGPVEFVSNNDNGLTPLETLTRGEGNIKFYNFRNISSTQRMISLRSNTSDSIYIYLSEQESYTEETLPNKTYCFEFGQDSFKLLKFEKTFDETKAKFTPQIEILDEKPIPTNDEVIDLWIIINHLQLVVGSWTLQNKKVKYSDYQVENLGSIIYIGFSSSSTASWKVANGKKVLFTALLFILIYLCLISWTSRPNWGY